MLYIADLPTQAGDTDQWLIVSDGADLEFPVSAQAQVMRQDKAAYVFPADGDAVSTSEKGAGVSSPDRAVLMDADVCFLSRLASSK